MFGKILGAKPRRNYFNMSHTNKLTCDFGNLVPIYCEDLVPGDSFKGSAQIFLRFAPLIGPIMHDVNIFTHFFFVPRRLIQSNWQTWISQAKQKAHESDVNLTLNPCIRDIVFGPDLDLSAEAVNFWNVGQGTGGINYNYPSSLWDYFDYPAYFQRTVPVGYTQRYKSVDIAPFLAYHLIFNEYYRDQDFIPPIEIDLEYIDSLKTPTTASQWANAVNELFTLRKVSWEKDYFTTGRSWAQKGDPVPLPGSLGGGPFAITNPEVYVAGGAPVIPLSNNLSMEGGAASRGGNMHVTGSSYDQTITQLSGNASFPGMTAGSATIADLRLAYVMQLWMERNARFGTRYTEFIRAHFDVETPDARLQRPEYIGGGRTPVSISEVLQTSQTNGQQTPLATMGGHAYGLGSDNNFNYKATEHGFIVGLMYVMPRSCYTDGMPRRYQRRSWDDYYFPEFAHLGEQTIYNNELVDRGDYGSVSATDVSAGEAFDGWAYQERYGEYKFHQSRVHGDFLNPDGMGDWHMARQWTTLPAMNAEFISSQDVTHRIFAVESDVNPLWVDIRFKIDAIRPIPTVVNTANAHHGYGS